MALALLTALTFAAGVPRAGAPGTTGRSTPGGGEVPGKPGRTSAMFVNVPSG